jgi:RNA-directed DNA polymerase
VCRNPRDVILARHRVNYFAHGNASECFSYVRDFVAKKVRRHLARNSKRTDFGWKRWSRQWLYTHLGLIAAYRVNHGPRQKALPA